MLSIRIPLYVLSCILFPFISWAQQVQILTPETAYNFTSKNLHTGGSRLSFGLEAAKNLTGNKGATSVFLGNGAGQFMLAGEHIIAIGDNSMSNAGGSRNIGIGTNTLSLATKWDNIAIGRDAQQGNQIGVANIALGSNSLQYNIISSYNIGVGLNALTNLGITGNDGNNNISIGAFSQVENLEGNQNIAIGTWSLELNQTGNNNVSIGYNALSRALGSRNVGMGTRALRKATLAENAVGIGYEAGLNDTLALNSVYIGYQAGRGDVEHAKSGNVFIGHRAGYYELGNDRLYIDNSDTATPLIKGNFANDRLEVNGFLMANGNFDVSGNATIDGDLTIKQQTNLEGDFTNLTHGNIATSSGLRIRNGNSSNYWRVFTASTSGDLHLYNNANNGGNTIVGTFDQATGAYSTPSDARLKTDIQTMREVLPQVNDMNIKSYKFIASKTSQRSIGVIAQEVMEDFSELVSHDPETDSYSLDYAGFSMVALKAIQEQQAIIKELLERVEKLENEK